MKKSRDIYKTSSSFSPKMPESIAELVEGMADDFNNILTTVMGACSLIDRDKDANVELLQYVNLIRTSAERAAKLSNSLMRSCSHELENSDSIIIEKSSSKKLTSSRDKKSKNGIVSPNDNSGSGPS